jgi:DNA-binding NtrC family response regulator
MSYRLFQIDQDMEQQESLDRVLTPDDGFVWERTCRDVLRSGQLLTTAEVIVATIGAAVGPAAEFCRWLSEQQSQAPRIAVFPSDSSEELIQTVVGSCDDFVFQPVRKAELQRRVLRLLDPRRSEVEETTARLLAEIGCTELVGRDPAFLRVLQSIVRIASSDAPVLITGETGTGKELGARAIHQLSRRCSYAFVAADCSVIPDHLFENEMFGHDRGAFTDARDSRKGLVSLAEGGTLLLDEIDSLSLAAQAKLLRFLQERVYKPLGSERFCSADVHVIAASNRDLEASVRSLQFRSDLFYRLNVLRLRLPPLRERRGDIPLLAQHFLTSFAPAGSAPRSFSASALRKLTLYDWPGNVRELANVVQRAAIFSDAEHIPAAAIEPAAQAGVVTIADETRSFRQARKSAIEAFERGFVEKTLHEHQGNVTQSAKAVGKDRRAFGRLVKKYGILRVQPQRRADVDPPRDAQLPPRGY